MPHQSDPIVMYATIKIVVQKKRRISISDLIDNISADCDYSIKYDNSDAKITGTEFLELSTTPPLNY